MGGLHNLQGVVIVKEENQEADDKAHGLVVIAVPEAEVRKGENSRFRGGGAYFGGRGEVEACAQTKREGLKTLIQKIKNTWRRRETNGEEGQQIEKKGNKLRRRAFRGWKARTSSARAGVRG
jgi:hypothetical protein